MSRSVLMAIGLFGATQLRAQVRVVNLIPPAFGDEVTWNPEPTLAVNPAQPNMLAVSSFLLGTDVCTSGNVSPILVSRDGGVHWALVCKLPSPGLTILPPADVVLRWSTNGQRLYAAYIWNGALIVAYTDDVYSPDPMKILINRPHDDQPNLIVFPVNGRDRVMIAGSYKDLTPQAAVLWADDPAPGDTFKLAMLERRSVTQNYSARLAAHASGRVYALYNGVATELDTSKTDFLDFTVVRDDSGGSSANAFASLLSRPAPSPVAACPTNDTLPGVRVVRCRPFPDDYTGKAGKAFGYQRRMPVLVSIAVDPTDASGNRLFVAWGDSTGTSLEQLHVAGSIDGGQTWQQLITIDNGTNPAVAVDQRGRLGFLFQQLSADTAGPHWVTRLLVMNPGGSVTREYVLASIPALSTILLSQPYIGDWIELATIGDDFVGVFSGGNKPDTTYFPNGVVFQRRILIDGSRLVKRAMITGTGPIESTVAPSIDPFFFRVGPGESPRCVQLRAQLTTPLQNPAILPGQRSSPAAQEMARIGCDR